MRFLPTTLRSLFKPVPLMDAQSDIHHADLVGRELQDAVAEHERVANEIRYDDAQRIRATMDDLFELLGKPK